MSHIQTQALQFIFVTTLLTGPGGVDAARAVKEASPQPAGSTGSSTCAVRAAHYCSSFAEGRSGSNPTAGVLALRIAVCRGDVDGASRFLESISRGSYSKDDLRFALGNLALLKGRKKEALRIFTTLKEDSPESGWGDWGLGLTALSDGDTGGAAAFMRNAYLHRPANLEAETAVLRHLVKHWLRNESAPEEDTFLALFQSFTFFRDCYLKKG